MRILPLLLAILSPAALGAVQTQERTTVLGTVIDGSTGGPVNGAFVTLLDAGGERLAATLSDASGRYVLRGVPGTELRLRVERIGLESVRSELLALDAGAVVTRDFVLQPAAVTLAGVEVEVSNSRRCSLDGDRASTTVRLWEEARKALEVARWVDEVGYRYEVRNYTRQVDRDVRTVLGERNVRETLMGKAAYASLDPDSLAARGFVQRDSRGWAFFGPDAQTLLSDAFLSTHCFQAVREEGRLGLAFEPSRDNRLPDVTGTLWFGEGGVLDRVEFRYTQLEDDLARLDGVELAGGEVRFALMDEGAWIVREWWIRMPLLGLPQGPGGVGRRRGTRIVGYSEVGGRILSAERARADRTAFGDRTGAVTGRILRSDSSEGLAEARVFLSGTGYGGRSSPDGSFVLDGVRPGRYRLVVQHPVLDRLGMAGLDQMVSVVGDEFTSVDLSVPTVDQVLDDRCRDLSPVPLAGWEDVRGDAAIHAGGVLRPPSGQGGEGWPVRIRWGTQRLGATGRDVRARWAGAEQRTGTGGSWAFCQLPPGAEVQLSWARRRPEAGERTSWSAWITLGRPDAGARLWRVLEPGR